MPMTAYWGFPDPAVFEGNDAEERAYFADVLEMIKRHLEIFVNFPFNATNRLSLQSKLDELAQDGSS